MLTAIVDRFTRSYHSAKTKNAGVGLLSFITDKTKRFYQIRRKNTQIKRNISEFIAVTSVRSVPPRETEFRLEVLLPCYNQGRFLAAALSSVPKGVHATVINDASDDDTGEIVEGLRGSYDFKLIQNPINLKQSGCLNKAIELSENNLFMVLNADDCLLKYCVPTVLRLFELHPTIRMVGGDNISFQKDGLVRFNANMPRDLGYEPSVRIFGPLHARSYSRMSDLNMTMSSCTFLRSAWQSVGGFRQFSERVCACDDRDFQMRVSALFDVAVIEEPLALYRVGSSVSAVI